MTGMEPDNAPEREVLTRDEARRLAEEHRDAGQPDPFRLQVPPSLLSAEHIKDYVLKTGAIAPFYMDGGRRSRLKMATYEGRIGKHAFVYNKQGRLDSLKFDKELTIKANSIVFVECDLDFRLPNYLALRFNLQIRHVHRGLLLGTGPLVDPGYWGKLCIPLHNLTDEDYSISRDDGLIWVEFTKTTAGEQDAPPLGRPPLEPPEARSGYWDIREFIERAARPRSGIGESVPIRSSISRVRRRAERAATSARKAQRWVRGIGISAALAVATALVALALGFVVFIQDAYNSLAPRIDVLEERYSSVEKITTDVGSGHLPSAIRELTRQNEGLRKRISELERNMATLHLSESRIEGNSGAGAE